MPPNPAISPLAKNQLTCIYTGNDKPFVILPKDPVFNCADGPVQVTFVNNTKERAIIILLSAGREFTGKKHVYESNLPWIEGDEFHSSALNANDGQETKSMPLANLPAGQNISYGYFAVAVPIPYIAADAKNVPIPSIRTAMDPVVVIYK